MNLEFPSLIDYGLERAADVLARAFEDYFVRIPFTVAGLLNATRVDSVDLTSSRMFVRDGAAVGGALIARRGWTSRLAVTSCRKPAAPASVAQPCCICWLKRKRAAIAQWSWR